jgi:acetyl-CoA carboxylase carboxyltransferase component
VDAVVEPAELRREVTLRLAYAAGRDRRFSDRRHGVHPV